MKSSDGKYHIHGKTYDVLIGSRAQVGHATAYKTSGGLTKSELFKNKHDRYVSLKKAGYFTKKGKFGAVNKFGSTKKRRHSKRKY